MIFSCYGTIIDRSIAMKRVWKRVKCKKDLNVIKVIMS